jgi:hypothetical protein
MLKDLSNINGIETIRTISGLTHFVACGHLVDNNLSEVLFRIQQPQAKMGHILIIKI